MFRKNYIEQPQKQIKMSTETSMEELQLVVLETDESEPEEESHAYASFGYLSQSSVRWEKWNLKILISKLIKT